MTAQVIHHSTIKIMAFFCAAALVKAEIASLDRWVRHLRHQGCGKFKQTCLNEASYLFTHLLFSLQGSQRRRKPDETRKRCVWNLATKHPCWCRARLFLIISLPTISYSISRKRGNLLSSGNVRHAGACSHLCYLPICRHVQIRLWSQGILHGGRVL